MESVKKMLLVEPSLIEKLKQSTASDTPLSRLDSDMNNILKKNIDDREKCILYLQTLRRYLNFTKEDRQPYHIPVISENDKTFDDLIMNYKNENLDNKSVVSIDASDEKVVTRQSKTPEKNLYTANKILELIPKTYAKKAVLLMNLLSSNENKIKWDEDGTVTVDNKKIYGSNILDLVNDSLRPLKKSDPIGWETFAKALKDIRVPLTYIGNPKRSEFISCMQKESSTSTPGEEFSTPTSETGYKGKVKNKLEWEKWEPY